MNRLAIILLLAAGLAGCARHEPGRAMELQPVYPAVTGTDPAMVDLIAPYRAEVRKWELPIGRSAVQLTVERRREELGFWVSDVLYEEVPRLTGRQLDAFFMNSAGTRATLPKGEVSYRTVAEILPFDNTVVIFTLDAAQVRRLAEHLAKSDGTNSITQMTVTGDADRRLLDVTIGGKPLEEGRTYVLGTNNYLASGGGGFDFLPGWPHEETSVVVREAVADHVRRLHAEGREIQMPPGLPRYHYPPKEGSR